MPREGQKQFGWMDEKLLEALDGLAREHGQSRREVAERLLERALGSGEEAPELVEGQAERVAWASKKLGVHPDIFTARALSSLLERVDNGWKGPVSLPSSSKPGKEGSRIPTEQRFQREGFVGSKLTPNADVPELGWWRPGSEEARPREVRESLLSPEQKRALAQSTG